MSADRHAIRLMGFGLLACFASAFGQTFYISLFNPAWREAFGLSHGQLGALYSGATLLSGLTLIQVGRSLDHVSLGRYTGLAVLGFALACGVVAGAPGPAVLFAGILGLRLCGQGLMGHIAISSMARFFERRRGRAIAVATLGFPLGEALWPSVVVALLGALSWRWLYAGSAGVLLLAILPLLLWLPRGAPAADPEAMARATGVSRRVVLRDRRFWLVLPVVLAAPFIVTGLFFHQAALAGAKGWPMALLASAFLAFAAAQVGSSLGSGVLIDRFGARNLLRLYPLPMGLAGLLVAWVDGAWVAFLYMALLGVSAGAISALSGALWAELYGTRHIGAIRALQTGFMVFSTAASPVLLGTLMDAGVGMPALAAAMGIYALVVGPTLGGVVAGEGEMVAS